MNCHVLVFMLASKLSLLERLYSKDVFFEENQYMKWTPGDESPDIEDRRDEGGGGGFQFGGIHIGIGGA
ncbi:MAG TPA: hypothetical protein VIH75_18055, partial [Candidatus Sulfotelmatobacter sp.]